MANPTFKDFVAGMDAAEAKNTKPTFADFIKNNPDAVPEQPSNKGIINDTLVGLGKGVMEIPSALTGLADIPAGLLGANRPFDKATDTIGNATGFQPKKWAEEANKAYSPKMQEAKQNIDDVWNNPDTNGLDVAKAYIDNPRAIAGTVTESIPSMFAGNGIGVGAKALGLTKTAAAAAGVGEGAIMAGQSMDNIDKSVDPQKAALGATAIGVGGGLIGTQSGRFANKLGIGDVDQAIISGGREGLGDSTVPMYKRVLGSAVTEGPIEEGSQSALETGVQNYVEDKPLTQGMGRNVVEGSIAGVAMGAPMGIVSGPLTRAAANAPQPDQTEQPIGDNIVPPVTPPVDQSVSPVVLTADTTQQVTDDAINIKREAIKANLEERKKAVANAGDDRVVTDGDKAYSGDSYIWGRLVNGKDNPTYEQAKQEFDALHAQQNPSSEEANQPTGQERLLNESASANGALSSQPTETNDATQFETDTPTESETQGTGEIASRSDTIDEQAQAEEKPIEPFVATHTDPRDKFRYMQIGENQYITEQNYYDADKRNRIYTNENNLLQPIDNTGKDETRTDNQGTADTGINIADDAGIAGERSVEGSGITPAGDGDTIPRDENSLGGSVAEPIYKGQAADTRNNLGINDEEIKPPKELPQATVEPESESLQVPESGNDAASLSSKTDQQVQIQDSAIQSGQGVDTPSADDTDVNPSNSMELELRDKIRLTREQFNVEPDYIKNTDISVEKRKVHDVLGSRDGWFIINSNGDAIGHGYRNKKDAEYEANNSNISNPKKGQLLNDLNGLIDTLKRIKSEQETSKTEGQKKVEESATQGAVTNTPLKLKDFADKALNDSGYKNSYLSDDELLSNFKSDQRGKWKTYIESEASKNRIPDDVLDDYYNEFGEGNFNARMRGVNEVGRGDWQPKHIRDEKVPPARKKTVLEKESYERTWTEQLAQERKSASRKLTQVEIKEAKSKWLSDIEKAARDGKDIPANVKKIKDSLVEKASKVTKIETTQSQDNNVGKEAVPGKEEVTPVTDKKELRKIQVKTSQGAWQYVVDSPEGLRYTIYSTDALTADKLEYAKATDKDAEFRVEPYSKTSPDEVARKSDTDLQVKQDEEPLFTDYAKAQKAQKSLGKDYSISKVDGGWTVTESELSKALKKAGINSNIPASKSGKLRRVSEKLAKEAHDMLNGMVAGQPVLSSRDRNLRERSAEKMRKSAELMRQADEIDKQPTAAKDSADNSESQPSKDEQAAETDLQAKQSEEPKTDESISLSQKITNAQNRAQESIRKRKNLNVYTPDIKSDITSKGKHNRLLVFKDGNAIEIREDYQGLPMSTESDRMRVANDTYQRMHGKGSYLNLVDVFDYDGSVWYRYSIDNSKVKPFKDDGTKEQSNPSMQGKTPKDTTEVDTQQNTTNASDSSAPLVEGKPDDSGIMFSKKDSDKEYLSAVNNGDMETVQRLVNDAAEKSGYGLSDYQMSHEAPNKNDYNISDLSVIYPDDIYSSMATRYYGDGNPHDSEAMHKLQRAKGKKPNSIFMVYRAVPKGLKETTPRNGDWVSTTRGYAEDHGKAYLPEGYRIIAYPASIKDIFTDGNSIHELGYDNGKNYAYADTKNNRKLLDPVTYDNEGNIIPLSKRFNKRSDDSRFSQSQSKTQNPHTKSSLIQSMRKVMDSKFYSGWFSALEGTGKFEVISRDDALKISSKAGDAKGLYNPENDTSYIVFDNISQDSTDKELTGLLMHEVSSHALKLGLNDKSFQDLLKQVKLMHKSGNKFIAAGYERALNAFGLDAAPSEGVTQSVSANPIKSGDIIAARAAIKKIANNVSTVNGSLVSGGMKSNVGEHSSGIGGTSAKSLSDFFDSRPTFFHSDGEVDVETLEHMLSLMLGSSQDSKVLDSVIRFAPIDVVDMLVGRKTPSQVLLHDKPMLIRGDSGNAIYNSISSDIYSALRVALAMSKFSSAGLRAESSLPGFNSARGDIKNSSADSTRNIRSSSGLGISVASRAGGSAKTTIGANLNAAFDTIINRHGVTPNSDVMLDGVGVDAPSSSPIVSQELFWEEVLSYAIEAEPNHSLSQRVISLIRKALRAIGKALPITQRAKWIKWANTLQQSDIISMATDALRSAPTSLLYDDVSSDKSIRLAQDKGAKSGSMKKIAWHGSSQNFDRFDLSNFGTGEGGGAFGYGIHVSEAKTEAEEYVTDDVSLSINGEKVYANDSRHPIAKLILKEGYDNALQQAIEVSEKRPDLPYPKKRIEIIRSLNSSIIKDIGNKGRLYSVEIPGDDNDYLWWDRPLGKQSDKVQKALYEYTKTLDDKTKGGEVYTYINRKDGLDDKKTSEHLLSLGIKGIKYKTTLHVSKRGTYNYTIFSDKDINIINPDYKDNPNILSSTSKWQGSAYDYTDNGGDKTGTINAKLEAMVAQYANVDGKPSRAELKAAVDQYRTVEAKYFNKDGTPKDGAMLAPNGKPTNLNKIQWIQTRTDNFKKWFGDSKAVDENGGPRIMYHGTAADFDKFNGFVNWFSESPSFAGEYSEMRDYNKGSGGNVIPAFVKAVRQFDADKIKARGDTIAAFVTEMADQARNNGVEFDNKEVASLISVIKESAREEESGPHYSPYQFWMETNSSFGRTGSNAIAKLFDIFGFDSIKFTEMGEPTVGVFSSNQVKSSVGNTGTFNQLSDDIRFSMASDAKEFATQSDAWKNTTRNLDKLSDSAKNNVYALATMRQLVDIGKTGLNSMTKYLDAHTAMNKVVEKIMQEGDAVTKKWEQLVPNSSIPFKDIPAKKANKAMQVKLADTMHYATVYGQDPTKPYLGKQDDEEAKANHRYVSALYGNLNATAKEVFKLAADTHTSNMARVFAANRKQIENSDASREAKDKMLESLTNTMKESSKIYFPLSRFGDYWLYFDKDGIEYFNMFETEGELRTFKESNPDIDVVSEGKKFDTSKTLDGVSGEFIGNVNRLLEEISDPDERGQLQDAMYQLYLQSLPDISSRKHFIHRNKTPGYHEDALRGFAHKVFHDAKMIGRLENRPALEQHLLDMREAINAAQNRNTRNKFVDRLELLHMMPDDVETPQDKEQALLDLNLEYVAKEPDAKKRQRLIERDTKALEDRLTMADNIGNQHVKYTRILNELQASHDASMAPNTAGWATFINSIGFMNYLGFSASAAIVNTLQTPVVSLPYMASRYGFNKVNKELSKAFKEFYSGKNSDNHLSIEGVLNERAKGIPAKLISGQNVTEQERKALQEKQAFDEMHDRGILTRTRSMDLIGLGEEGVSHGSLRRKLMYASAYMFNRAEVLNREITGMTAFRLAMSRPGATFDQAIEYADEVINTTHGDYTSGNRARIMRGNVSRVVTQFKQYSQMMTYLWGRTALDAFGVSRKIAKGQALNEQDKEAVRLLQGMIIMQGATAGLMGLPIGGFMVAAQLLADGIDDDDDPIDVEAAIKSLIYNNVTDKFNLNDAIVRGPLTAWTGVDFQSRLNQSDMWFREPDRELEGQYGTNYLAETLGGPIVGIAQNILDGKKMIGEDHMMQGIEKLLPKAIKDPITALRYHKEGARTLRHDLIEDINIAEAIAKAGGFNSADLSLKYDQNFIKSRIQRLYKTRYGHIMDMAATAKRDGNNEAFQEAKQDILEWNKTNPDMKITMGKVLASVKQRNKTSKKMDDGFLSDRRLKDKTKQFDFAE
jgi:hypothetical protein